MKKIGTCDREKLLKFIAEGRQLAKILRLDQFRKRNAFLTCAWRFLGSTTLEQFNFKSKKMTPTGKIGKSIFLHICRNNTKGQTKS